MPDLDDTIETMAAEPLKASVDGQSAENRPIEQVIQADQYLSAKSALSDGGSAWGKTRMAKASFPGGGTH